MLTGAKQSRGKTAMLSLQARGRQLQSWLECMSADSKMTGQLVAGAYLTIDLESRTCIMWETSWPS